MKREASNKLLKDKQQTKRGERDREGERSP